MTDARNADTRRRYRVSLFLDGGDLGDGGLCYQKGPYGSEERAVEEALAHLRSPDPSPPTRARISRPQQHSLWLRLDGDEVVRFERDPDERKRVWGYAS